MRAEKTLLNKIDWLVVSTYLVLVLLGWLNIYAAVYDEELQKGIFDLSLNSGKQFLWICTSMVIIIVIMTVDFRFYDSFAYIVYGLIMLMLVFVLFAGTKVAGSTSWFSIAGFRVQPSEFAKFATALALAKYMSKVNYKLSNFNDLLVTGAIIVLPAVLIIVQGDTGTALVFGAFVLVMYREGLNPTILVIGLIAIALFVLTLVIDQKILIIAVLVVGALVILLGKKKWKRIATIVAGMLIVISVIWSVDYFVNEILKPHQQNRIKALINPEADPLGYGWNVTQSKIAIGSGGLLGKGYLQGTQTKFDFVPEQSTDFIFCTLGEEQGWLGTTLVIFLFVFFMVRIVHIAERQKETFARVYGYSVASILFLHFMVNVGMTIGLFPVIGIPLPLFSYGGSSLWAFTILIFILLKIDAHRMQVLVRH
ncbi:MAG: rod shape-determining protein RodA [Cyclobacteriaceae bacterium]|nr:rod shape-determining protein RodA [Cyclobacteriaceae bacterium]